MPMVDFHWKMHRTTGHAVAISNDWLAISAPLDYGGSGKVSLFWLDSVISGGQLEPDFELVASDKQVSKYMCMS